MACTSFFVACADKKAQKRTSRSDQFENPVFVHSVSSEDQYYRSFPFDKSLSDSERLDSLGFFQFIDTLNAYFTESKIDIGEKDILYFDLLNSEFGERYYSSDPAKIAGDIALKKVKSNYYQVFHRYYDCGWNYSLQEYAWDPIQSNIVEVETWVARRPC